MKISSPAFGPGAFIPVEFTCDGANISPPLTIGDVPKHTKSLALIMDDPDAPMGLWVHWLVWNIPPDTAHIEKGLRVPWPQGVTSSRKPFYGGPCPPPGTHRYYFHLYALDTMLELRPSAQKHDLEKAMEGHILAQAQAMGRYSRHHKVQDSASGHNY